MKSALQKLRDRGLPGTWTTVQIGYRAGLVSREDVQSYACDQLGLATGDADYLAFRLFDADPTNNWEITSILEQLVDSECAALGPAVYQQAVTVAQRTWNVFAIRDWLWKAGPDPDGDTIFYFLELIADPSSYLLFPDEFDFQLPTDLLQTQPRYAYTNDEWPLFNGALAALQQWADDQESTLRGETMAASDE